MNISRPALVNACTIRAAHYAGENDAPKRPHTRHGHCAVLYRNEMIVLGGETDAQARGKDSNKGSVAWGHIIWKLNLETWQWHRIEPQVCYHRCASSMSHPLCLHGHANKDRGFVQEPCPGVRHDACVAQRDNQLFYYGGRPPEGVSATGGNTEFGDLWALDLDICTWRMLCEEPPAPQLCQETPLAGPEARHSACMWCWGDSLFLFGGAARRAGSECTFGDFWRYSLTRQCWAATPLRGARSSISLPNAEASHLRLSIQADVLVALGGIRLMPVCPQGIHHRRAQRPCSLSAHRAALSFAGDMRHLLFVLHQRLPMAPPLWSTSRRIGD